MEPIRFFHFCPQCGRPAPPAAASNSFRCEVCGWLYFFNPAVAAAGFIEGPDGRVLFIRRAHNPAKDKLAVPGGFVDRGETAEAALRREVKEEVNLELETVRYLGSFSNQYTYQEITYPVLDVFFVARARSATAVAAVDGVAGYAWLDPAQVRVEDLAFPSMRLALELYLRR